MVKYTKILEMDAEDRPREKLKKLGAKNLTDKELLAILLRTGTKELNALDLAKKILEEVGELKNLRDVTFLELMKYKGIGEVKAINLLASLEFAYRIEASFKEDKIALTSPLNVARFLRRDVKNLRQEVFFVLDIDTKGKLISKNEVYKGTVNEAILNAREVFKNALRNSATSVICVHNHPSGDPTPSLNDIFMTLKLKKWGEMLGVKMLDHIIVADNGYVSIKKFLSKIDNTKLQNSDLTKEDYNFIINNYDFIDDY